MPTASPAGKQEAQLWLAARSNAKIRVAKVVQPRFEILPSCFAEGKYRRKLFDNVCKNAIRQIIKSVRDHLLAPKPALNVEKIAVPTVVALDSVTLETARRK